MIKRNKPDKAGFSFAGFFFLILAVGFAATASIFVYYFATIYAGGNIWVVMPSVLIIIILCALFYSFLDIWRRKVMVERPTSLILEATKRISSGDFDVKLVPFHEYKEYDEYDLIFENINLMARELKKNELLKTDFISNVSHEIKTPLAVLQNYAKALNSSKLTEDKRKEYLNGIIIQTQKLSGLISNILKLNKLENQELVPEFKEFDLSELVRVCALNFESLLEKKNLELECDIDEVKIVNSESLLEIVLNNLISNAIKFTDEGKISISLKQDKTYATIKIADTGCGISKEVGKHIFDKFYQADTSHSSEGNGLGLALVKKVIDVIGGEIFVESKVGVGTTFIVKLKKEN